MNSWKTEREIPYDIPYVWNLKGNNPKNFFTKQKETCRLEEQTYACQGEGWGRNSQGVSDGQVYIAVCKLDNQRGPTVQHRELCSMLCGSLDGRGVWG